MHCSAHARGLVLLVVGPVKDRWALLVLLKIVLFGCGACEGGLKRTRESGSVIADMCMKEMQRTAFVYSPLKQQAGTSSKQ